MRLQHFKSELSFNHKVLRLVWGIVSATLFRCSPRTFHGWRCSLLRLFGARIGKHVRVYNTAKVFYPPNLVLKDHAVIGCHVELYCVAPIVIGSNSMVSQYSYLCAGSHDYNQPHMPLIASPIFVGKQVWVCAKAFVGPGISIADRAVVAACAVVTKDVASKTVVGGNPAKFIKTVGGSTRNSIAPTTPKKSPQLLSPVGAASFAPVGADAELVH